MKYRILIASSYTPSIVNFRGDLIRGITSLGHEVLASGPEKGYEKDIEKLGARFAYVPLERAGTGIFEDLKYFSRIFSLLKIKKPDIVFCYTIKPVIYGSIAAKISGVKRIYPMVTGLGYVFTGTGVNLKILKLAACFLYGIAFSCAENVFFQNRDDMNELLKLNLVKPEKCVLVNGSGVNMDIFKKKPLPENISFLMIARLLRTKGVMEYLEAARAVKRVYPDAEFTLVGPQEKGPDAVSHEDLRPYIEKGIVNYPGRRDDVRPYLERCSVYVLPSYREGTPRTVLEAMATGRPVITTDAPGCRETVRDGVNGLLVAVKDTGSLAEKMVWMIENRDELPAMAEASRRICGERFDVTKVNSVLLYGMGLVGKGSVFSEYARKRGSDNA